MDSNRRLLLQARETVSASSLERRAGGAFGKVAGGRRHEDFAGSGLVHARRGMRLFATMSTRSPDRSVYGLVRTTTVLSRCDRGADENWRRRSSA